MSMAYQIIEFFLIGGLFLLIGFLWGRKAGNKTTAGAGHRQQPQQTDVPRDRSFQAGFQAGHLQGWRDATAPAPAPPTTSGPLQVSPAPERARRDLAEDGFIFQPETINPTDSPHAGSPFVSEQERQWIPLAGSDRQPTAAVPPSMDLPSPAIVSASSGQAWSRQGFAPPPPAWPTPQETEGERRARKEKRDRQNINITLYMASLLLVAAGALFLGTNLPTLLKFVGVCGITALFYTAGFVLHRRVPRLRPAAVAFAGTGLALIPVVGLALYNFALQDGPIAWLTTSLLGLAAYSFAAVRLESRVLAYLSLTFVVSSTWSGVSVLGGALVWYFTAMIGLAVLLTLLTALRPRWLPPLYVKPLIQLHPLVVPAVAVSVTLVPLLVTKAEYALVMFLCGLYLAVVAAVPGRFRLLNFYGARAALTVAGAAAVWELTDRPSSMALAISALLAVQALVLGFSRQRVARWFGGGTNRWNLDVAATFTVQLIGSWVWVIWTGFEAGYRPSGLPVWLPLLATLLIGMALATRLLGVAEWMPVATIVAAASVSHVLGERQLVVFLILAVLFWLLRAVLPGPGRGYFVLAARVASTLAVPLVVFEVMGESAQRIVGALLAFILALVMQQLVSAGLLKVGIRTLSPGSTLAGSAIAGLLAIIAMPSFDETPGKALTATTLLVQLGAAFVIGWLLLLNGRLSGDHADGRSQGRWIPTVGELLPLVASLILVPLAFSQVSLAAGNIALLLTAAYLTASGARLSTVRHRWTYWWMARGMLTVLGLTVFQQITDAAGPLVFAGESFTPSLVAVLVLGAQLVFPLAAWHLSVERVPSHGAMVGDVAVVLGLQAMAVLLLGSSMDNSGMGWPGTLCAVVLALSAASSGFVLRGNVPAASLAPSVFAFLLVIRGDKILDVELVLAIFTVYGLAMVMAIQGNRTKGAYFLGVRVLSAALVVVLIHDVTGSASAVAVSLAVVLAAQHGIRWLMRNRLAEISYQQAAVWGTLAVQAVLPIQEILLGRLSSGAEAGSLRWVVLLELVLLLASAVTASRSFAARGAVYLSVYAAVFGIVALGPLLRSGAGPEQQAVFLAAPVLSHDGVALVLLALSIAGAAFGIFVRRRHLPSGETSRIGATYSRRAIPDIEDRLWLAASGAAAVTACAVSPLAADWIAGVSILVVSVVCFVASHLERIGALYPPAVLAALAGASLAALDIVSVGDDPWGSYLPWLAGCGLSAAILYLGRWANQAQLATDPLRRWSLAGGGIVGLAFVAAMGLAEDATAGTAAVLVTAVSLACWLEAPTRIRRLTAELGALAVTASVQRAVLFIGWPAQGPDPFWAAQWFVILAALLAALRFAAGQSLPGRVILGAGAALLSASGIAIVFGGTQSQQLWVLVLLAILLLVGAARNEPLFVWWGAAGVTLCLMWAMRQYTFALLALMAVALIIFAVWRLNRTKPAAADSSGASGAPDRAPNGEGPVGGP
ncbi:hypothetical protein [Arthrobacter rhizosphaerae]|uniref:hypothetical protein n=1 Tax=Arthrobacter rhizosphaerae TaxID=2855490 RepID=UPI001FF40400|nr:hypothetical protein [Arthrobacter rhizosphaerae]